LPGLKAKAVLKIPICKFLGLLDPDLLVGGGIRILLFSHKVVERTEIKLAKYL
jgi:hypothetical protein